MFRDDLSTIILGEHDPGVKTTLSEHPEVKILFERYHKLPPQIEINGVNPILHVLLEGAVENQLQDPDLPEVKAAIERLEGKGLSRHAARACVVMIFTKFSYEVLVHKKTFDKEKYKRQLHLLGTDFARVGRNEPCPCGSGLKFKRCCAPEADHFKIHKLAGALCLGQGGYILDSPGSPGPLQPFSAQVHLKGINPELRRHFLWQHNHLPFYQPGSPALRAGLEAAPLK